MSESALRRPTDAARAAAGLVDTLSAVQISRRIYQRMLTYTINKVMKTLEIAVFASTRRWKPVDRLSMMRQRARQTRPEWNGDGCRMPSLRTGCSWVTDPSWSRAAAPGRPQNEAALPPLRSDLPLVPTGAA
jgi:hypothetical protein